MLKNNLLNGLKSYVTVKFYWNQTGARLGAESVGAITTQPMKRRQQIPKGPKGKKKWVGDFTITVIIKHYTRE